MTGSGNDATVLAMLRMHPFTNRKSDSVAALGEEALIQSIRGWLGRATPPSPFGIGDDCAVLMASHWPQLVTVDPVIFGRHFDAKIAPGDVGQKLLKRNLSDIAAMGGRPRAAVIALTLDQRTRTAWVEGFYRGLATTARKYRVGIVGGDVAQADGVLAASLTLIGETRQRAMLRGGAQPGDWIYVTGELGNTLRSGHHYQFEPRLAQGEWLAGQPAVRAMMDVSDGLAKDLHALTPRGAVAALDPKAIPCRRGADLKSAMSDGEDYELLFAVGARTNLAAFEGRWRKTFASLRLTRIGRFVVANELPAGSINLTQFRGYEHLR